MSTAQEHEDAVLSAEVKCLIHALAPYRVLSHDTLRREARAISWHEPGFEQALYAAIAAGKIEQLPLGFYRLPHGNDKNKRW